MGKYEKGEVIKSLDELAIQDFIYMDNKVYHWAWIHSMQFRSLLLALNGNRIRRAVPNGKADATHKIICHGGEVCLLDEDDFIRMENYKWYFDGKYVHRTELDWKNHRKGIRIHREVMGNPVGQKIDHINGDPLDNRKVNLRIATTSQNACNKKKSSVKMSSKYKGVTYRGKNESWEAAINHGNKCYHIGNWEREEDAAMAYNDKARELFGEYARLNEIDNQNKYADYMNRKLKKGISRKKREESK